MDRWEERWLQFKVEINIMEIKIMNETGTCEKSLGQVAYEGLGNKNITPWTILSPEDKDAWNQAATAVQTDVRVASGLRDVVNFNPLNPEGKELSFEEELRHLINKHSIENDSGTPDFILAGFICSQLIVYSNTMIRRDKWHGNSSLDMINKKYEDCSIVHYSSVDSGCALDPSGE